MTAKRGCWVLFIGLWLISNSIYSLGEWMGSTGKVPNKISQSVVKNVFEIVIPKPSEKSLVYSKDLPTQNIPYQFRIDPYLPIGSAFLIEKDIFVSAAHVLSLEGESMVEEYFIRDSNKNIYPIEEIIQYSFHRDFVKFKVVGPPFDRFLNVKEKPNLNSVVYAVGNALGQGIVIRNGLLTSETFEEQDGEWKWLRFSAAASPGNSGGPLLNRKGEVIGVILRKSQNENLNYALSVKDMNEVPMYTAEIRHRQKFGWMNIVSTNSKMFSTSIQLPLSPRDLRIEINKRFDLFYKTNIESLYSDLETKYKANPTPINMPLDKLESLLEFPILIGQRENGGWSVFQTPKRYQLAITPTLSIAYGRLGSLMLNVLNYSEPFDRYQEIINSDQLMNNLLLGNPLTRQVGDDSIRIQSLGKATVNEWIVDQYGRKWQFHQWNIPFNDSCILAMTHVMPNGAFTYMYYGNIKQNFVKYNIQQLANFMVFRHMGSIKQWVQFLDDKTIGADGLKAIKLRDKRQVLSIQTDQLAIKLSKKEQNISAKYQLAVDFWPNQMFTTDYSVKQVVLRESVLSANSMRWLEYPKLSSLMTKNDQLFLSNIKDKKFPFNGKVIDAGLKKSIKSGIGYSDSYWVLGIDSDKDHSNKRLSQRFNNLKEITFFR